ncbi:MAG: DNA-directed RNA polymerase subunit alpha [Candidatus Moranbacteria bacterium]|nr:DNA-directed RNA polymerase subunit alpha [Candidatus Moranbacteria bacterium]
MQLITLPQKPKFTSLDGYAGKFEIEGCYPGYGTTLGNALRRVLLSSLPGSAITSVKIKGVTHEFSTMPNVLEDVIQVILNLKQVRFKSYNDEPVKVSLSAKGERVITAGMIECPTGVEVITKDAHIATITSPKGELEMELEIRNGIGYVPVEQQERGEKEIGVIAVDAIYTPIKRVNYSVDNMRVGKKTDYEKITLEITTDGSIDPKEAFAKAVAILVEQFSVFGTLAEVEKKEPVVEETVVKEAVEEEIKEKKEDPNKVEVVALKNLSTRTMNVLESNKIATVGAIVKMTEAELTDLEGMGAKGVKEIKKAIGEYGVNLKQDK